MIKRNAKRGISRTSLITRKVGERERDRRLSSANEKVVTTPFDRLCLTPFRLITTHFENRFRTRDLA